MKKHTLLNACVFPSEIPTVAVVVDDIYGGAHNYKINNCKGFQDGDTLYADTYQYINFVHKSDDGEISDGLQSEQLVLALIDRHRKLNNRFPSPQNEKMITGLQMFLEACQERVEQRMSKGIMGELKA